MGIRLVLDFFLARTLDRLLAETGVLDFKFKFVPVAACRTRIDSDLHAFRAAGRSQILLFATVQWPKFLM